jgi:hypothetical protein
LSGNFENCSNFIKLPILVNLKYFLNIKFVNFSGHLDDFGV